MRKFRLVISQDDDSDSPRDWGNPGTMVCFHTRRSLGDKHTFETPHELEEFLQSDAVAIWLPIYGYEHGGITINHTGFSCPWDSGRLGAIFFTKDEVEKYFPDATEEILKNQLIHEIEIYNMYLQGMVWYLDLSEVKNCECCGLDNYEFVDSISGVYDDNPEAHWESFLDFTLQPGDELSIVRK